MMKTGTQHRISWALPGAGLTLLLLSFAVCSHVIPTNSKQILNKLSTRSDPAAVEYQWSYISNGRYSGSADGELTMNCQAQGRWQINPQSQLSKFLIASFRCNDQDLTPKDSFSFKPSELLALDPKVLSSASPINALALALLREANLGVSSMPEDRDHWSYDEERLEGSLPRQVSIEERGKIIRWSKNFRGVIPSRPEITHRITAESSGQSSPQGDPFASIELLHMKEVEAVSAGGKKISTVEVSIEIKRIEASSPILAAAALPLALPTQDPEHERRDVLALWNAFLSHPGNDKATNDPLYVRLKLAFRHDPRFTAEFRHVLEQHPPETEEFKMLLGALAYAGTEEATDILVESAKAKGADPLWQRAIAPVLGLATHPTASSWAYLEAMRTHAEDPDLRKAAELAMAGEYRRGLKNSATEDFLNEIRSRDDQSIDSIQSILDVVGNASLEEEVPRLAEWAKRPEPGLRSAVAEAMRLMDSGESEELLLRLLADADTDVGRSAAHAFETRTPSVKALPYLLAELSKSSDELLQVSLLETLYASRSLDPELLSKLKELRPKLSLNPAVQTRWKEIEQSLGADS